MKRYAKMLLMATALTALAVGSAHATMSASQGGQRPPGNYSYQTYSGPKGVGGLNNAAKNAYIGASPGYTSRDGTTHYSPFGVGYNSNGDPVQQNWK
jgi:hypothetical protein